MFNRRPLLAASAVDNPGAYHLPADHLVSPSMPHLEPAAAPLYRQNIQRASQMLTLCGLIGMAASCVFDINPALPIAITAISSASLILSYSPSAYLPLAPILTQIEETIEESIALVSPKAARHLTKPFYGDHTEELSQLLKESLQSGHLYQKFNPLLTSLLKGNLHKLSFKKQGDALAICLRFNTETTFKLPQKEELFLPRDLKFTVAKGKLSFPDKQCAPQETLNRFLYREKQIWQQVAVDQEDAFVFTFLNEPLIPTFAKESLSEDRRDPDLYLKMLAKAADSIKES